MPFVRGGKCKNKKIYPAKEEKKANHKRKSETLKESNALQKEKVAVIAAT
jgi:hypothetical protein